MSQPKSAERIQKVLASAGLGSRREIEGWIAAGRISINGKPARPGDRLSAHDKVRLDGRVLKLQPLLPVKTRILAYHKPAGEICSHRDEKGRATVFDSLPRLKHGRWINIGRLDINTSGLLLFTNDGDLAHRLMHPSSEIEREYAVRVFGEVSREALDRMRKGIRLEDGIARFISIRDGGGQGSNHWYHVVLQEGRKHEVRRLWESQGVMVSRLVRIRFGPCVLPKQLRSGQYRELKPDEVKDFIKSI